MPDQPRASASRKLDAALDLAAHGFSVFPLIPNSKLPLIKGWKDAATADPAQIAEWWAAEPQANIGIATERLLVVDIDPRKGGGETMKALQMVEDFPDTLASVTAGGGAHLIFALPDGETVSGGVNRLGQGIDIKAHGGLIVGPGSVIDGKPYQWVPGHRPGERRMAEAPQWIRERCVRPAQKNDAAGTRIVDEDETARAQAEHWLAKHAPEAVEGERDNTAFAIAAKLYDFGVIPATCRELLLEWNEGWCQPPLDASDIERIVASARTNRQTAVGSKHANAPGFEPVEIEPRAAQAADIGLIEAPPAPRPALYALSYAEAATKAVEDATEPLIESLLDRHAMSVWYGESNTGKTFVMLDAAWHIAAGREWAGKPVKQGTVVYIAAEGGKGILKRVKALKDRYPEAGDVPLHIVPCPVDLLRRDADLKPLIALIQSIGVAELVVVDTLSRAIAGGNENDSTDMGGFVANLDLLRRATTAHVAVVHHTGKDKAKGARGHSLLRAATDTEIEIDKRTLQVTKQRDMDGNLKLFFGLRAAKVGVSRGKDVTSCTVDMNGMGPVETEPEPLTGAEGRVYRTLKEHFLKRDNLDTETVFGTGFFAENASDKDPTKALSRSRLSELLSDLSDKGWIIFREENQYVMRDHPTCRKFIGSK